MGKLTYNKITKGQYEVFINTVNIGEFLMDVDGYWKYWPNDHRSGYWDEWMLTILAEELHKLNKNWDQEVKAAISKNDQRRNPGTDH